MKNKLTFQMPPFKRDDETVRPTLLLHSCCAPCSSSVIELLSQYFELTVFYFNPNIYPYDEYEKRAQEQIRFCDKFSDGTIKTVVCDHEGDAFEALAQGKTNEPEGGNRCSMCYALRLERTAAYAREKGFDCFATTLSVSPLKDAARLNAIGEALGKKYGVHYLVSDFKKQNGYKRSCEISREYGMYRQDFCGCRYSMAQRLISAKGFIFDADGTLFDTMQFYEDFANRYLVMKGFEPLPDMRERIRAKTIRECCEFMKDTFNMPCTADEIFEEVSSMMTELYDRDAPLKEGVLDFLDFARANGKKMCIATATARELISMTLKRLGIEDYFEFVLTCPEVGASKRYPRIYDEAALRLGLRQCDTLVFEDAHHAMETAYKAGYKVVAVRDDTELKFMDQIEKYSNIYVENLSELIFARN